MAGIKESKEALSGAFALAICVIEVAKDGLQFSDALALFNKIQSDPALKQELDDALSGLKHVPGEMSDLDGAEGIELGIHVMSEVPALLAALK